jgi:FAD binding domain
MLAEAIPQREGQLEWRQALWTLKTRLQGELMLPGDDDFEAARSVWNGAYDRHPALIVRCVDAADVTTAINFAREHSLVVSVRSGGHSIVGHSTNDGGMVIDLSRMKAITIEPIRSTARIEPGLTWSEVADPALSCWRVRGFPDGGGRAAHPRGLPGGNVCTARGTQEAL